MNSFHTDDGKILNEGAVLELLRFPGTKWVLHEGWYFYMNCQIYGWYLSSIPYNTTIPLNNSDIRLIKKVYTDYEDISTGPDLSESSCNFSCNCNHNCKNNCIDQLPFTPDLAYQLMRAFITVDTMSDLQKMIDDHIDIPNGKIARVNSVDGASAYFVYDTESNSWISESFNLPLQNYYTRAESDAIYPKLSDLKQEVASQISESPLLGIKIHTELNPELTGDEKCIWTVNSDKPVCGIQLKDVDSGLLIQNNISITQDNTSFSIEFVESNVPEGKYQVSYMC